MFLSILFIYISKISSYNDSYDGYNLQDSIEKKSTFPSDFDEKKNRKNYEKYFFLNIPKNKDEKVTVETKNMNLNDKPYDDFITIESSLLTLEDFDSITTSKFSNLHFEKYICSFVNSEFKIKLYQWYNVRMYSSTTFYFIFFVSEDIEKPLFKLGLSKYDSDEIVSIYDLHFENKKIYKK